MHDQAALLHLGHELLGCICEAVGAQKFKPSRGASSGLHQAWQCIIKSLTCNSLLTDEDLLVIKKYTNLQRLCLGTENGPGRPVWFSVGQLAPALVRLVDLEISSSDVSSYQVLKTLVGTHSLQARLERLDISAPGDGSLLHIIDDDDMHALSALKKLKSLHLEYKKLQVSQQVLQAASKQLLGLTHLGLTSAEEQVDIMQGSTQEQVAVFPGSLTNLVNLSLWDEWGNDIEDEQMEQLSQVRQRHLTSAVSSLVNLRWLQTNYPLMDPAAQQQALGALTQLTYLSLSYVPAPCEFTALSKLPQLRELWLWECYHVQAAATLSHTCLQKVQSAGLTGISEGLPASACTITSLIFTYSDNTDEQQADEALQHLPKLPKLARFTARRLAPTGDRYLHLAALIERQADTLLSLKLQLDSPFEEPVVEQLSQCTKLQLLGRSASRYTLQLLGQGKLPCLETFQMTFQEGLHSVVAGADLRWLRSCSRLRKVRLLSSTDELALAGALRDALAGALPAVEVVVREQAEEEEEGNKSDSSDEE